MVERSQPRPRGRASPAPGITAQQGISSPSSTSSPSSPRSTSLTTDHKHADTLLSRNDSHSSHQSTVTPHESLEMDVRPRRLKRRKAPSRQSSPESVKTTSPDPPTISKAARRLGVHEKQVQDASTRQVSPSPSPAPSQRKGKEPAADYPSSPSIDGDLETTSIRSTSPERSDDEPLTDDATQEDSPTCSTPAIPAAKQLEIDAVVSRLPRPGPRIEPDTNTNIEIDERLLVDEGFCDETLESHYQAFMAATEELRSKRRPYYRVRTPGAQKGTTLVQRSVVQKGIRMRRREPKAPAALESGAASGSAVASSSSAT